MHSRVVPPPKSNCQRDARHCVSLFCKRGGVLALASGDLEAAGKLLNFGASGFDSTNKGRLHHHL